MDSFDLKKFLVENKLTYNSKLINEGQALSPDDQKIVKDILGSLEEGVFSGVLDKVRSYAKKGLVTATVLTALLGAPNLTQAQKQDIKNVAQTEMSSQQVDMSAFATNRPTAKATQSGEDVRIQSYTNLIQKTITNGTKSQITNLFVEVIKSTEVKTGKIEIIYQISGQIQASSQKEANAKAMSIIKDTLNKTDMSLAGLTIMNEGDQSFPFKVQIKVLVNK